ncbi:hypothetical protein AAMO2058_000700200 [Amorphochlora amoebiformis]
MGAMKWVVLVVLAVQGASGIRRKRSNDTVMSGDGCEEGTGSEGVPCVSNETVETDPIIVEEKPPVDPANEPGGFVDPKMVNITDWDSSDGKVKSEETNAEQQARMNGIKKAIARHKEAAKAANANRGKCKRDKASNVDIYANGEIWADPEIVNETPVVSPKKTNEISDAKMLDSACTEDNASDGVDELPKPLEPSKQLQN